MFMNEIMHKCLGCGGYYSAAVNQTFCLKCCQNRIKTKDRTMGERDMTKTKFLMIHNINASIEPELEGSFTEKAMAVEIQSMRDSYNVLDVIETATQVTVVFEN